jgi:hypothetical protein
MLLLTLYLGCKAVLVGASAWGFSQGSDGQDENKPRSHRVHSLKSEISATGSGAETRVLRR